jgi:hypothetical protein
MGMMSVAKTLIVVNVRFDRLWTLSLPLEVDVHAKCKK